MTQQVWLQHPPVDHNKSLSLTRQPVPQHSHDVWEMPKALCLQILKRDQWAGQTSD